MCDYSPIHFNLSGDSSKPVLQSHLWLWPADLQVECSWHVAKSQAKKQSNYNDTSIMVCLSPYHHMWNNIKSVVVDAHLQHYNLTVQ